MVRRAPVDDGRVLRELDRQLLRGDASRGSAVLPHPEKVQEIVDADFEKAKSVNDQFVIARAQTERSVKLPLHKMHFWIDVCDFYLKQITEYEKEKVEFDAGTRKNAPYRPKNHSWRAPRSPAGN